MHGLTFTVLVIQAALGFIIALLLSIDARLVNIEKKINDNNKKKINDNNKEKKDETKSKV